MNKLNIIDIENELKRENYHIKYNKILKSTIYGLIIILSVATIIASLLMPVIEINETTMSPILDNNDIVLTIKTNNIKKGDIIAFYHGNKILIKRVVAISSDWIYIDNDGNVNINGLLIDEPYVKNKMLGDSNIEYPMQVQEKKIFVLSDDRSSLTDSRNSEIGLIDYDNIIGKIIFRIWPIKKIGKV